MTGEKQVFVVPEDKFYQATGMYYEEWHPLYLANNSGKELEGRDAEDFKKGMVFVKEQLSQVIALQDLVLKKENKIGDLEDEHKKLRAAVAYKDLEITRREMEVEHNKEVLKKESEKLQNSDAAKLEDKLKATEQELQDAHKEAAEELNVVKDAYCRKVKNTVALQRIKYEKEICRFKKESSDLENKLIGLLGTNEPLYKLIGEIQVSPEDIKAQPPSDDGTVRIQIVKSDDLKMATIPQNSKVIFYVDADGTNPLIARGRLECGFVYFSLSDLVTDESETDKAALVNLMLKDIAEGRKSAHIIPYSAETIVNILEKRIIETKMPETEAVKLLKAKATAAENELINLKKGSVAMMKYLSTINEKKYEEAVKELKETYEAKIAELGGKVEQESAPKLGNVKVEEMVQKSGLGKEYGDEAYSWYDTGIEFDRTGKISEAIEAYSKGIELEYKFHKPTIIISLLEHRAEERRARLESIENQGDIWYYVGKKLENLGILDDALKAYKKALFCVPMDLNFKESKELLEKKLNEIHETKSEPTSPQASPAAVQDEKYVYQFMPRFWSDTVVVHEVQKDKSLKFIGEYNPFGAVCKKIKGAEVKDLSTEVVSSIVKVYIKQHQLAKEMPIQLGDVKGIIRQQGEQIEILYKNLTYTVKDDALLDKDNNVVTEPGALKLFSAYRYQKSQESQERSWLEDALGI